MTEPAGDEDASGLAAGACREAGSHPSAQGHTLVSRPARRRRSYRQHDVNVNVDVSPRVGCARRLWRSRYRLRNLVSNYLSCPYGLMKSALEVRPGVVYLLTEVS